MGSTLLRIANLICLARRRYELAEREFVSAKLELHKTTDQKELLSEHLATVIQETELRKAKHLAKLCQTLSIAATSDGVGVANDEVREQD